MTQLRRLSNLVSFAALIHVLTPACGADDTSLPGQPSTADANIVVTQAGSVRGSASELMRSFKGIPYALPPVGALRWQPPKPAETLTAVRDATKLATHCPQPASPFGLAANTAEDCLYLNVYTPTTAGPHPVMVWIHGGAFYLGQSDEYDPTPLIKQGVVVVTINYRLGALAGFALVAVVWHVAARLYHREQLATSA